jgi:phosphatidylglycerophosphate synthase
MSNTMIPEPRSPQDEEMDRHPSIEPWLSISFLGLLPLILAFYLAEEWKPYLFVAGGLLLVASAVMLVRQERRKSAGRRD